MSTDTLPEAVRAQLRATIKSAMQSAKNFVTDEAYDQATDAVVKLLEAAARQERTRHDVLYPCGCSRDYCPTHKPGYLPDAAASHQLPQDRLMAAKLRVIDTPSIENIDALVDVAAGGQNSD